MALVEIFGSVSLQDDQDQWLQNSPRREGLIRAPVVGYNPVITTEAYIWPEGGNYTWTTVTAPVELSSSDAADGVGGVGALTVRVYGLDASLLPISELVTMNGLAPVATQLSFFRINTLVVETVGVYGGTNSGKISCIQQTSAILMSTISIDDGISQQCIFTVPAGYNGFVQGIHLSPSSSKTAVDFTGASRRNPEGLVTPFTPHLHLGRWFDVLGSIDFEYRNARPIAPGTDIWMLGTKSGVGNDPGASAEIDLIMFPVDARRF